MILLVTAVVFWLLGSVLPGPLVRLANDTYASMNEPSLRLAHGDHRAWRWDVLRSRAASRAQGRRDTRIDLAASLYKRCEEMEKECFVIVSGGNPQHHEQSEADLYGVCFSPQA